MGKQKTRKQRAGAFVAQGSYGCGFAKPPLPCKGEATRRNNKFLSKLMSSKALKDELKQATPFLAADPTQEYFLPPRNSCKLNSSKVVPENQIGMCKFKNEKDLLFYEYGGDNLTSLKLSADGVIPFFESLINLFEGLASAHKAKIYLLDIKPDNLVSIRQPDGTYKTRFIDFGLSLIPTKKIVPIYETIYKYWSFDVLVATNKNSLDLPLSKLIEWEAQQQIFSPQCIPAGQFELFATNNTDAIRAIYQPILKNTHLLLSKADVFALGLVLSDIMFSITGHNPSNKTNLRSIYYNFSVVVENKLPEDLLWDSKAKEYHTLLAKEVTGPFFGLVRQMLEVDPQKRLTPEQALAFYNLILPKIRKYMTADNINSYCRPLAPRRFL